jgi:hypothetical protein
LPVALFETEERPETLGAFLVAGATLRPALLAVVAAAFALGFVTFVFSAL